MFTAFRVGIFIFLALVCLSVGVFLIGSKDFLFGSGYRLQTDFRNVGGLNNGADVRVGGIHEGTVKEIDLPSQPDGKVTVVMTLRKGTSQIIKKDSVASIETEGLLGDKYIEISFGSAKAGGSTATAYAKAAEAAHPSCHRGRRPIVHPGIRAS